MTSDTINDDKTMSGGEGTLLVNRYRIVRQLGQGGMGSVWLAGDTQLDNKLFAVKMLPSILVSNKRAYRQLKDEALVAMKLTHPNIVTLRAFEENNGNPFLVMDYVDGETLDDYLAEKGGGNLTQSRREAEAQRNLEDGRFGCGIPEEDVIRILKPIAAALDYAHGEGVVHRDVKPANIMIRKDGHPYILDFGIAREIQETMTRVTGKLSSGTLLYMSPEQLHGAAPKKEQDIYSFAAMAYECLSGAPPFSRGQIEYQIDNDTPEPLVSAASQGGCGQVGGLAAGIMAGLAKNPEDRPPTCAAVMSGNVSRGAAYVRSKALVHDAAPHGGTVTKVVVVFALFVAICSGSHYVWQRQKSSASASSVPSSATNAIWRTSIDKGSVTNAVTRPPLTTPKQEPKPLPRPEPPASLPRPEPPKQEETACPKPSQKPAPAVMKKPVQQPIRQKAPAPTPESRHETVTVSAKSLESIDTRSFKGGECRRVEIAKNVAFDMVWCPPGSFMMGSPEKECERRQNESRRSMNIDHGFWIGRYEVSQGLWMHVMGENPSQLRVSGDAFDFPVDTVSRDGALVFLKRLNEEAGTSLFRLPTEVEWEYACRAASKTAYSFGDVATSADMQVRGSRLDGGQVRSGTFRPNAWGIYDMHGNLAEWCEDRYVPEYGTEPGWRNQGYVLRGGSWQGRVFEARSAARDNQNGDKLSPAFGFRLCFSSKQAGRSDEDWGVTETTRLALEAFQAGNWSLGFSLSERADMDNPDIQRWLGKCYDPFVSTPGFRISKDLLRAKEHYNRAEELSNKKKGNE